MLYALTDISLMLLIGKGRCIVAYRVEVVRTDLTVIDILLKNIEIVRLTFAKQLNNDHLITEMVEHHHILIEDIQKVWGIILRLCLILHVDILEIAHGIERGIAEESAVLAILALHLEGREELVDELG